MKNFLIPIRLCVSMLFLINIAASTQLQAQASYKLSGAKENTIKVKGKSNVHDWTMVADNPTSEASFGAINAEDGIPKSLTSLSFSVSAKNLKSDSESMNNRTYKAIKADAYPQIVFKLREATIVPVQKGKFSIKATGTLTIAGVSKVIDLMVKGDVRPDQTIVCTGEEHLKLTDYGIQPPSFMLGAMKVGNDLDISFTLNFKK